MGRASTRPGSSRTRSASSGAIATTAASGHHAMPRTAYAPIDEEEAEPHQGRPRHSPAAPRHERHDEQRRCEEQDPRHVPHGRRLPLSDPVVTAGCAEQTDGVGPHRRPERRQARGSALTSRDDQRPVRAASPVARSSSQARPRTAGARKKLPCRFAQTSDDERHQPQPSRGGGRSITSSSVDREQAMPSSCGRSASASAATTNAARTSHDDVRAVRARDAGRSRGGSRR